MRVANSKGIFAINTCNHANPTPILSLFCPQMRSKREATNRRVILIIRLIPKILKVMTAKLKGTNDIIERIAKTTKDRLLPERKEAYPSRMAERM